MDLETQLKRFEQQLDVFEKLHTDELKKFEEKLATYLRLQADEVEFLREELAALKQELATYQSNEPAHAPPAAQPPNQPVLNPVPQLTRREFLGGTSNPGPR